MRSQIFGRQKYDKKAFFWQNVEKGISCWVWKGPLQNSGYGRVGSVLAHRFSWILHYGSVPKEKCVLHHCDNPPCVNPTHLFLGTHKDNGEDRAIKGRTKTHKRLTEAQVKQIRLRYAQGEKQHGLAREFKVAQMTISKLVRYETWKKVIYLCGPFRGLNQWEVHQNILLSERVSLQIWRMGGAVISPHLNTQNFQSAAPDECWLQGDLAILSRCDVIVLLPRWETSSGSLNEVAKAKELQIPIFIWDDILQDGWRDFHGLFEPPGFFNTLSHYLRANP